MMRLWRCLTALVLALLLTLSVGAAGTAGFSDVPESHWAAQSIQRCVQTGLLQGVGGGRFGLGRTMTPRGLRHSALPSDGLGARHAGEGQLYGQSGYGEVVLQRY